MCCVDSVLCDELVTRSEESYRLCVTVCDLETSTVRQHRPELGGSAKKKTFSRLTLIYPKSHKVSFSRRP